MIWDNLSQLQWIKYSSIPNKIPEDIIEQYLNKVRFTTICKVYNLSFGFIDKYQDKINWQILSSNENIIWNEEYLSKYIDKITFETVKFLLPEDFIIKYKDRLPFRGLNLNVFTEKTIKECYEQIKPHINNIKIANIHLANHFDNDIDWHKQFVLKNDNIPANKLQYVLNEINKSNNSYSINYNTHELIVNQINITKEFILNNLDKIDIKDLGKNMNMNQDLKNKIIIFS